MNRRVNWRTIMLVIAATLLVIGALAGCRSRSREAPVEEAPAAEVATESPAQAPTEQSAEPAEEPVAEPTAVSEPVEAPAAPSVESAAETQGACDHPYYPIRDGALYRYQMTAPGIEPSEMTIAFSVTGPDSFMTTQTFSGVTTETAWQCTADGLLRTDFGLGGLDIPGVEYSVDGITGVTFPPKDQLVDGAAWQSNFNMSGEMNMEAVTMQITIEAVTDNVLAGFEQVTTPAGTFEAVKVDSTTTLEIETGMGAVPAIPAMETTTTLWLSEGVGMVKSVSADPAGGTSSMELVALE